jgi:hypothetical protein
MPQVPKRLIGATAFSICRQCQGEVIASAIRRRLRGMRRPPRPGFLFASGLELNLLLTTCPMSLPRFI